MILIDSSRKRRVVCVWALGLATLSTTTGCGPALIATSWPESKTKTEFVAPSIVLASLLDAELRDADRNRSWMKLPVTLLLRNDNSHAVAVQIDVQYDINNQFGLRDDLRPHATLDRRAGTDTIVILPARKTTTHFLTWNIAKDLGLGLDKSSSSTVVRLYCRLKDTEGLPYRDSWTATTSTSPETQPFVSIPTTLSAASGRIATSADNRTNRSRQIFRSKFVNAQERIIEVDQQFAPIQIPGLKPTPVFVGGSGTSSITPLDSDKGPACVVRRADDFYILKWPLVVTSTSPNPEIQQITQFKIEGSAQLAEMPPIRFRFGQRQLVAFFGLDKWQTQGQNITAPVFPHVASIDENRDLALVSSRWPIQRNISSTYKSDIHRITAIDIDWRDDAVDEKLVVLASPGAQAAKGWAGGQGWFDVLHIKASANTENTTFQTTPLPQMPALSSSIDKIARWHIDAWPNADHPTRPGLILVQELEGNPRQRVLHVLEQNATGGFKDQKWSSAVVTPASGHKMLGIETKDLDGDGSGELLLFQEKIADKSKSKVDLIWFKDGNFGSSLEVRTLLNTESTNGGGAPRLQFLDVVDVNGDDLLDLVAKDFDNYNKQQDSKFVYYPSALSGVAMRIENVAQRAGSAPSARPASVDVTADGLLDIISNGRIFAGRDDGKYDLVTGGIGGNQNTIYRADQICQPGANTPDRIDVIAYAPGASDTIENFMISLVDLGPDRTARAVDKRPIRSKGQPITKLLPWMRPGNAGRMKHLVSIVRTTNGVHQLYQLQPDAVNCETATSFEILNTPVLADSLAPDHLAVVRRGDLERSPDIRRNAVVQDVFCVAEDARTIFWLDSADSYRAHKIESIVPTNERIIALDAASSSEDEREDILLTTVSGTGTLRYTMRLLEQRPGGFLENGTPTTRILQLFEVDTSKGANEFLGVGFDQNSQTLASGMILMRHEARTVLPSTDRYAKGAFRPLMVRSPIEDASSNPLSLVVEDYDRDGIIEVLVGSKDSNTLMRVGRGY